MNEHAVNSDEIAANDETDSSKHEKHAKKNHEKPEHPENTNHQEIKKLEEEIAVLRLESAKLKEDNAALDDSYRRKVAEFDNYRKRMIKQMEDTSAESVRK